MHVSGKTRKEAGYLKTRYLREGRKVTKVPAATAFCRGHCVLQERGNSKEDKGKAHRWIWIEITMGLHCGAKPSLRRNDFFEFRVQVDRASGIHFQFPLPILEAGFLDDDVVLTVRNLHV